MSFRTYRDVSGADRSGLLAQITAQRERVRERLSAVRHVILVTSGKGGVGKSHTTASLAIALARRGHAVGVVDADLRSPTVARLLGASGPLEVTADGVLPARGADNVAAISSDFFLEEGRPLAWREPDGERFVWRGALEVGAVREFLSDVRWGALDYLFIDLPPGADGATDLGDVVPRFSGAVAVTIPSEESRRSVARTLEAVRQAGIRILGVVENMSGYRCGGCGTTGPLYDGDAGATLARAFQVPLIARLPFDSSASALRPGEEIEALADRFPEISA